MQEEVKEEKLRFTPTEDIAAQLLEHAAVLFKIVSCSNNMQGSLVDKMKDTVAFMGAATMILIEQARGRIGSPELLAPQRQINNLRTENKELRREVEKLKKARAFSDSPPPLYIRRKAQVN